MKKCKNCGRVLGSAYEDEFCPKCAKARDEGQDYKLFKIMSRRKLLIGLRDAAIILVIAWIVSLTPIGRFLKWYVVICAGVTLASHLATYLYTVIKVNRALNKKGYRDVVLADDLFARCIYRLRGNRT